MFWFFLLLQFIFPGPFQYEGGEQEAKNSSAAILETALIVHHQPKITTLAFGFWPLIVFLQKYFMLSPSQNFMKSNNVMLYKFPEPKVTKNVLNPQRGPPRMSEPQNCPVQG